jgi:hypothetical protein
MPAILRYEPTWANWHPRHPESAFSVAVAASSPFFVSVHEQSRADAENPRWACVSEASIHTDDIQPTPFAGPKTAFASGNLASSGWIAIL